MLQEKILMDKNLYDKNYSILKLALTSYTTEGQKQYGNIYMRGSLVAGLLDLRLLELSKGKRGLKDVVNELAKKYGPYKPFNDDAFFDEFTKLTYPEIELFFEKYIKNTEPLPFKEYYNVIGIDYFDKIVDDVKSGIDFTYYPLPQGLYILRDSEEGANSNLKKGDLILSFNGEPANNSTVEELLLQLESRVIGSTYQVNYIRQGENINTEFKTIAKTQNFVFKESPNASENQRSLRKNWME